MELSADFKAHVIVYSDKIEWLASTMPQLDRRMLDQIGGEVARTTTIVRYPLGRLSLRDNRRI